MHQLPNEVKELFMLTTGTGSHFICEPPVMGTDFDYICLTINRDFRRVADLVAPLEALGFTCDYENPAYEGLEKYFTLPFKNAETRVNLIVISNPMYYDRWVKATEAAHYMNLETREERILLFKMFRYCKGRTEHVTTD